MHLDETNRKIIWGGEVTEELSLNFTKHFMTLSTSRDPITIICVGSVGGDWDTSGLGLTDLISNSPNEITYYGLGSQCSSAALMFCAGDNRVLSPNGYIMLHDGSLAVDDTTEGIKRIAQVTERMCDDTHKFLSRMPGMDKPPSYFKEKMRTDWYIFAEEALEIGLATEISTP